MIIFTPKSGDRIVMCIVGVVYTIYKHAIHSLFFFFLFFGSVTTMTEMFDSGYKSKPVINGFS